MNDDNAEPTSGPKSASQEEKSPPRQRRGFWFLRFRLRTLLILIPLIVMGLSLFVVPRWRDYLEKEAETALTEGGAQLVRDKQDHVIRVYFYGITDEKFREIAPHLANLRHLNELDIVGSDVTDEAVPLLERLSRLKTVYLHKTQVSEEGIARLSQMRPSLNIEQTIPEPIATGLAARDIYRHAIVSLAFNPGGDLLAAGDGEGALRIWETSTGMVHRVVESAHDGWLFDIDFHPHGQLLATGGSDNAIRFWDVVTGRKVGELSGHEDDVHAVAFTPDGRRLVSTSDDMTVRVWDVGEQTVLATLQGHENTIPGLAISPDGRLAASASRDGTIRLWDLNKLDSVGLLCGHQDDVMSVAFESDGRHLVSAGYDRTVRRWNLESGETVDQLDGFDDWLFFVAGDWQRLAVGSGDGVHLIDPHAGARLLPHSNVAQVAFHPTQPLVASASAEGNVGLWNTRGDYLTRVFWTRFGERDLVDTAVH